MKALRMIVLLSPLLMICGKLIAAILAGETNNRVVAQRHDMQSGCAASRPCSMNCPTWRRMTEMSILSRNYVKGPSLSRRPVFQSHIGFCSKYQGQSQGRAVFGGKMKRAQRSYAAIAIPIAPQSVLQNLSPKTRKFIFMLRSPWEAGSSHQIWYLHRSQLAAG